MRFIKSAALAAATFALCATGASAQQSARDPEVSNQRLVTDGDLSAAKNAKSHSYHVTPAAIPGAAARAAAMNIEGARAATEDVGGNLLTATPASVPSPAAPYFYPADLANGTNPNYNFTLTSATHHAIYVNMPTGTTVASNWGNPEGFLQDLKWSRFIHLTDQYTGMTTSGRYSVGAHTYAKYSYTGNTLSETQLAGIVHSAALATGAGPGHLYHVFLHSGVDTCFDDGSGCYSPDNYSTWAFCAYHTAWNFNDIGLVFFTVEPYQNVSGCSVTTPSPNGQLADSTDSVLSHEVFEAITDPVPGYAWINRISLDLRGYEIGDECQPLTDANGFLVPTFTIYQHSYAVQLEYSNRYHACAAQP